MVEFTRTRIIPGDLVCVKRWSPIFSARFESQKQNDLYVVIARKHIEDYLYGVVLLFPQCVWHSVQDVLKVSDP